MFVASSHATKMNSLNVYWADDSQLDWESVIPKPLQTRITDPPIVFIVNGNLMSPGSLRRQIWWYLVRFYATPNSKVMVSGSPLSVVGSRGCEVRPFHCVQHVIKTVVHLSSMGFEFMDESYLLDLGPTDRTSAPWNCKSRPSVDSILVGFEFWIIWLPREDTFLWELYLSFARLVQKSVLLGFIPPEYVPMIKREDSTILTCLLM